MLGRSVSGMCAELEGLPPARLLHGIRPREVQPVHWLSPASRPPAIPLFKTALKKAHSSEQYGAVVDYANSANVLPSRAESAAPRAWLDVPDLVERPLSCSVVAAEAVPHVQLDALIDRKRV